MYINLISVNEVNAVTWTANIVEIESLEFKFTPLKEEMN